MSTSKHFDKICCIILASVLLITIVFVNGEAVGITPASRAMGYENRLFDYTRVHTIDLAVDGWEEFLETCTDEQYVDCAAVIDGEAYKNIAIRAKGNTSLSSVKNYGNNRYSFKIEFDHYDSGMTYHGLDKLCLNNIIQDNTYMKDFLVYQMMNKFGAAAPLCSFAYITVNGEDWGLYLAVEAVEESFLQRNYGADYGELYKPDSMSFGGGRGNGKEFDMDSFFDKNFSEEDIGNITENLPDDIKDKIPEDFDFSDIQGGFGQFGGMPDFGGEPPEGFGGMQGGNRPQRSDNSENGTAPEAPSTGFNRPEGGFGGDRGGMGSDDVKLNYIDDSPESYSNIFNNAKTDISDKDSERLITSLKKLSEADTSAVDIEAVIRYFVVHIFVCNGDSYTGNMIHNYYLYEEDGVLSMLPWDYNLAFGGFEGGSASAVVNKAIDTPVNGGIGDDRPMISWIFSEEQYTEQYHTLFSEFIAEVFDSGWAVELIESTAELITPYVQKDPTKFCTYEEFTKGAETLKSFCLLRAESVRGQLDGNIPSTTDRQNGSAALVDASSVTLSDMGSMGNNGGFGGGNFGGRPDFSENTGNGKINENGEALPEADGNPTENDSEAPENGEQNNQNGESGTNSRPSQSGGFPEGELPEIPNGGFNGERPELPDGGFDSFNGTGIPPEMPT